MSAGQNEIKFLVDENLSHKLAPALSKEYPGTIHVSEQNLSSVDDTQLWEFAKSNDFTILSKDNDFYYLSFARGCPPKVVRLDCGNKKTSFIVLLLQNNTEIIRNFIRSSTCYLEISLKIDL